MQPLRATTAEGAATPAAAAALHGATVIAATSAVYPNQSWPAALLHVLEQLCDVALGGAVDGAQQLAACKHKGP